MRLYLIAGEASGDLHGANLLRALQAQAPGLQARGMGGNQLQAAGLQLARHYGSADYIGFWEVAKNLPSILGMFRLLEADMLAYKPDAVLLIDYPGFNLRMAKFAKKHGLKVLYYISPQLWAWKKGRVRTVQQFVDRMYVILPFEQEFYQRHKVEAQFTGHPLLDALAQVQRQPNSLAQDASLDERPLIALLPGSRHHEVQRMLPTMLAAAQPFAGDYQLVVAGAPALSTSFYQQLLKDTPARLVAGRTYDVLRLAKAALVTSGTATLETALLGVPEVVCYRVSAASYRIARWLIKDLKYISLVNLIPDKLVVKELIQGQLTVQALSIELGQLLQDEPYRQQMLQHYTELRTLLGDAGASGRTASSMLSFLGA